MEYAMTTAIITSKGRVTIPVSVRASLGVGTGDKLEFIQLENGNFELVAVTLPVTAVKGMIKKASNIVTIEEINDAIALSGADAK